MRVTTTAIGLAGIIVLVAFLAPLAAFTRYGEFQVETGTTPDGMVELRITYQGPVALEEARLTVYSRGTIIASAEDPLLQDGESLTVTLDPGDLQEPVALEIEGRIAGIYYFKYRVEGGSP